MSNTRVCSDMGMWSSCSSQIADFGIFGGSADRWTHELIIGRLRSRTAGVWQSFSPCKTIMD